MKEAGLVIATDLITVLHEHVPQGRSAGHLPDEPDLWYNVLWPRRNEIAGIAHSHPGCGLPGPSYEDLTTFEAIESAYGRRLTWWIASSDMLITLRWYGPRPLDYVGCRLHIEPAWTGRLRELSGIENNEER